MNTCRTDASLRENRRYSSRRKTLEYCLEELAVALGCLSETGLHDPMHPMFAVIFYSNIGYRSAGIVISSLLHSLLSNNSSNKQAKSM